LENLSKEIKKIVESLPGIKFSADTYKIQKITDYQSGIGVGEAMFPEVYSLKGRPPLPFKILRQNQQHGVIHYTTGKLTLSMKNGEILAKKKKYFIMFDGEKLEGSTLFAVGVKKADPVIRPSDEIVIVDKSYNTLGVGHALISGRDMETVRFGAVAKIKKKVK
ncbi:MAG: PUA domain-containing protein, partial [Candidatus Heimdallarchaeota archaeon]